MAFGTMRFRSLRSLPLLLAGTLLIAQGLEADHIVDVSAFLHDERTKGCSQ